MHIQYAAVLFLLLQSSTFILGEVFTALVDMEGLVSTELELVRHLDNYIQAEENRLKRLRGWVTLQPPSLQELGFTDFFFSLSFLEEYESIYQEASADVTTYLANPINAYLLVKRLTSDWRQVEGVMTQNVGPGRSPQPTSSFISHLFVVIIIFVYILFVVFREM